MIPVTKFTCPACGGDVEPNTVDAFAAHIESCPSAPAPRVMTKNDMLAALGSAFRRPE